MRVKVIYAAVAFTVIVATALLMQTGAGQSGGIGKPLITTAVATQCTKLELVGKEGTLTLNKNDQGDWVLPSENNYPADAGKVDGFLRKLTTTAPAFKLLVDDRDLAGIGLATPLVVKLTLKDNKETTVRLGNLRAGGGQYARIGNDKTIYLIPRQLEFKSLVAEWAYGTFWDYAKPEIATVTISYPNRPEKKPLVFRRAENDMLLLADMGPKELPDNLKRGELTENVYRMPIYQRHAVGKEPVPTQFPLQLKVETTTGKSHTIRMWSKPGDPKGPNHTYGIFVDEHRGVASEVPASHTADFRNHWKSWVYELNPGLSKVFERERKEYILPAK